METLEYYKFIRNSVQLVDAELVSFNCLKRFPNEINNESKEVQILLQREVNLISEKKAELFLRSKVGIDEGIFEFDILFKGVCVATDELNKVSFEQYVYNQVVPLLLPYVRECIASTMARMKLPIFTLPTMDILDSLEANMPMGKDGDKE